jgi:hypothetical protein
MQPDASTRNAFLFLLFFRFPPVADGGADLSRRRSRANGWVTSVAALD